MIRSFNRLALVLLIALAPLGWARAQSPSGPSRIALVIGNGAYRPAPLPTAANDAGLVAQTLAAAGFEVTGARDLGGEALRRAFRDFLDKAAALGPQGTALVYLAGHALQFEGDNYFVPVDAALAHDADVPIETLRLADFTRALAGLRLASTIVIVDGAYGDPARRGSFAPGLALVDPDPGSLLAFNAAPGTFAPVAAAPYGSYATILTQTMKQGGVPVEEVFDRVRVGVNTATRGAVVPWNASKLTHSFAFFDRAPDAPALGSAQIPFASLRNRPLRDFTPEQAYDVALARDTLPAYQDYLTIFPDNPLARRIRVLLAARREASFWRDALRGNAPASFWTYLRRYPKGPHALEAQRRLSRLAAALSPPADFAPLAFDTPPPPEAEYPIIERRFIFADPDLEAPPPPPIFLLPPTAPELVLLPPPAPAPMRGFLPIPAPTAIPYVRALVEPGRIVPPRGFKGAYPQPRPFMAGPASGVIPQAGPGPEPKPGAARAPQPAAEPAHALPPPGPQSGPAAAPLPGVGAVQTSPATPGQRGGKPQGAAPLPVPGSPPVPSPEQAGAPQPGASPGGDQSGRKRQGPLRTPPADAGLTAPQSLPRPNLLPAPKAQTPAPPDAARPPVSVPTPGRAAPAHKLPAALPPARVPASGANPPVPRLPADGQRNPEPGQGRLQPQAAPRLPPAAPAPVRPDLQPPVRTPMQRPQIPVIGGPPQRAEPPARQPPGPGAEHGKPDRRPDCGHPGQPPCRP